MELIDIHVHFYPDQIAADTLRALTKPGEFEPCCDGTARGLREFMRRDGVSLSVNLPVATKKEQVAGINRKMIAFNRQSPGDVLCFGTMHPEFGQVGDVAEELRFLAASGVRGIKLHPEYQEFYPDEPRMVRIYEACRDAGLAVLFHAGFDFPFPFEGIRALPERLRQVVAIDGLTVICAHMGGYRMWEGVQKHLLGTKALFDTAFTTDMDDPLLRDMICAHGPGKVLFGSDFPWKRAGDIKRKIERAIPDPAVREMIFHRNAETLLGTGAPR